MAPHSAKMSTAGKTKAANNKKKSPEKVEAKVTKKKLKVRKVVSASTRELRHRPVSDVLTIIKSKQKIPLPITFNKLDLRTNMRFLCALGVPTSEIDRHLKTVYGKAISIRGVRKWCEKFRNGRTSVENGKRSGRPRKVKTSDGSNEVLDYIKTHRHAPNREIAFQMNIGISTVFNFIKEVLKYKLFLGCWVPMQLSEENKEDRLNFSTVNLARCKSESLTNFFNRIVVADQTWLYFHTTPLKKRPPYLKNEKGEIIKRDKKFQRKWTRETGPSPGISLLMTVFWDCAGVVAIDFKEPQELTQDSFCYGDQSSLKMLYDQVCAKRPGLLLTGLKLLMNENLWGEELKVVDEAGETITSRLTSFGWQGLFNPANSPDLAPSDYHLFQPLKKHVTGKRFVDAEAGKRCVVEWLWAQDPDFFATGVEELVTRWERCIKVKGNYLDK